MRNERPYLLDLYDPPGADVFRPARGFWHKVSVNFTSFSPGFRYLAHPLKGSRNIMERADFERKRQRQQSMTRIIYDLGMGILWTGVGIFLLIHDKLGIPINFDDLLGRIFGGSCILYGLFRIYRGYKSTRQGS